jgi:hypothetical protein
MSEEISSTAEVWKTIEDCPAYSVSNHGRVRRDSWAAHQTLTGVLKPYRNSYGYLQVDLRHNGKRLHGSVGRLVAHAFLDPDPKRKEVNHKDGIKANNRSDNLEWATRSENMRHAYLTGLKRGLEGEASGSAKLTAEQVKAIRCLLELGHPPAVIGALFSVTAVCIRHIRRGKTWSSV